MAIRAMPQSTAAKQSPKRLPRSAADVSGGVRQIMAWVHTWFGLFAGFVLMVCFFFGSLSMFDRELDLWGQPALRHSPRGLPSFDRVLRPAVERRMPEELPAGMAADEVGGVDSMSAYAGPRDPQIYTNITWKVPDGVETIRERGLFDATTGEWIVKNRPLKIGSGFFYPLHYNLTLEYRKLGDWIVAFAAVILLVALVTGVVMHKRIFREFFTFRPRKAPLRSTLDLHNMTGVIALPFHFMMAFTGLLIFAYIYFPMAETQLKPLATAAPRTAVALPDASGRPAAMVALDPLIERAQQIWRSRGLRDEVISYRIHHWNDGNGYVSVNRAGNDRMALNGGTVHLSTVNGAVIGEDPPPHALTDLWNYIVALHFSPHQDWLLRWLYVVAGLMGAVCIATGTLFFVRKRATSHSVQAEIIQAVGIASMTGMLLATCTLFVSNRIIPESESYGFLQKLAFFAAWLASLVHAWWLIRRRSLAQSSRVWVQQLVAAALLAFTAVIANWITTGDFLWETFRARNWPIAGVDIALLVSGLCMLGVARKLHCRSLADSVSDDVRLVERD